MRLAGIRYVLDGVASIGDAGPEVGITSALPLAPGLSVLYGQNGAGKSSVLEFLDAALTGRETRRPVELHLDLERDPDHPYQWSWQFLGEGERFYSEWEIVDASVRAWEVRGCYLSEGSLEELAEALLVSPKICLSPRGTADSPRWDVFLSMDLSDPILDPWRPRFVELVREQERLIDEWDDAEPEDEDLCEHLFGEVNDELAAHPFMAGWSEVLSRFERLGWVYRPEWLRPHVVDDGLPVPLVKIGSTQELKDLAVIGEPVQSFDGDALLPQMVGGVPECDPPGAPPRLSFVSEPERQVWRENRARCLQEVAAMVSAQVDELVETLLYDAPVLRVLLADETEWLSGPPFKWQAAKREQFGASAFDSDVHPWRSSRSLDQLSAAQRRWAWLAILLVSNGVALPGPAPTSSREEVPTVLIIDEPEAHLHRAAEGHTARGLQLLAKSSSRYVVVATHSPDLLNVPTSHLHRVHNGRVTSFDGPTRETMTELGMNPSDLLRISRTILLVEGHHDELVLSALIGDVLQKTRTVILPLQGATNLGSTVDSHVLFHFTEAHIIAVLDNVDEGLVKQTWGEAQTIALTTPTTGGQSSLNAAIAHVKKHLSGKNSETKFIRQWLIESLKKGSRSLRVTPFGLGKQDIIDYLPVEVFVNKNLSWEQLREQYSKWQKGAKVRKDFKGWLADTYGASFSDEQFFKAIDRLTSVPDDIQRLADECQHLVLPLGNSSGSR